MKGNAPPTMVLIYYYCTPWNTVTDTKKNIITAWKWSDLLANTECVEREGERERESGKIGINKMSQVDVKYSGVFFFFCFFFISRL